MLDPAAWDNSFNANLSNGSTMPVAEDKNTRVEWNAHDRLMERAWQNMRRAMAWCQVVGSTSAKRAGLKIRKE